VDSDDALLIFMVVRWLKKQLWTREFHDGNGWIVEYDKERRKKKEKGKKKKEVSHFTDIIFERRLIWKRRNC
jgi:hypothetical protein